MMIKSHDIFIHLFTHSVNIREFDMVQALCEALGIEQTRQTGLPSHREHSLIYINEGK